MKNEIIFIIEESLDGGFEAKAVGYSIFTEGDSIDELKLNIIDAVNCHFEDNTKPPIIRLHYIKEETISA
jgi:hypothetical protein